MWSWDGMGGEFKIEERGKTQRKKTHVWKKTHVNIKKWKEARMEGAQIMLKRMHGLQKVD